MHETGGDDTRYWRDAIALFERLRGLPAAEAEALLAGAPAPVRERLARMRAADATRGPLDQPLPEPRPPAQLGRWRIGEAIGRGGMSVVYRARSSQAPEDQLAAVKLLALAAPGAGGLARFEREIGILARLRHPGIAPLFDAGIAPDGRPWFAMGLVEGQAIDAWCASRGADRRQRVALVAQVAEAVAHAHRHLVVHRDIKPGNVMVDGEGRVVLLDFGISRVLEEGAAELTQGGSYPLTPRYAAPEQHQGGAVSTATDVWGLGALLHALLLDAPPRLPDGAEVVELPSDAALPDDLAAILRQALAREPGQRYASAADFAADLQAWLAGRPVQARRGGAAYRLRRWITRNPAAAGLSLALLASVLAGTGASLWQAREARQQAAAARASEAAADIARAGAERERDRAEAVRDYLAELFAASDPSLGRDTSAAELLDAGEARVDQALEAERPDVALDLLTLIAGARDARGEYDASQALYERALALADAHPGLEPRLRWTLWANYATQLRTRGQAPRAVGLLRDALALAEANGAGEDERIDLLVALATAESAAGDNAGAWDRIAPLRERFRAPDLQGSERHLRLLELMSTVTALLQRPDDRALFEERLQVAARVYADNPGWLAFTYADAVPTLRRWGEYARAQELADAAVGVADRAYAEPHVIAAIAYCNAAGLAIDRGDRDRARELLDRTLAIDAALRRVHVHALSCVLHRAELRADEGDMAGALADVSAAEAMREALGLGRDTRWHAVACAHAMQAHLVGGDLAGARRRSASCADATAEVGALGLARAELALHEGRHEDASARLPAFDPAAPIPGGAPRSLRALRLRLALLDATDPAAAAALRPRLLDAVAAMPGPWRDRARLRDCLATPGQVLGCPGQP